MTAKAESLGRRTSMKRARRWLSTACVVLATMMAEVEYSSAFSPSSDANSRNSVERRRANRITGPRFHEDDGTQRPTATGTDLGVVTSPAMIGVFETNNASPIRKSHSVSKVKPTYSSKASLPASSRAVSIGKRNRNSKMLRPKSRTSSPRVDGKSATLDHGGLLDKAQEQKLTVSIRSLRNVVRARDELLEYRDTIPTEAEWAEACDLSVLGLRRVMYEGQQARTVLVSANVGLVMSIAKRHFASLKQATQAGGGVGTILTLQDLVQEGNLGLMQAAERFEAERGHRFSTYATYWIRQRILRAISDSSRIIRLPAHVHSMLQKINRAKKDFMKEIGRTPSTHELAQYLEVSVDELEKYASRTRNVVSLESPLRTGGSLKEDTRTIGDLIASDAPTPEEDAQRESLKDDIRLAINELAELEREVLILRYGLENGESQTVSQTAKSMDISVDRVRLIETRALNKLRCPQRNYRLKEYVGDQHVEEEQIIEEMQQIPEKIWFF